MMSLRCCLSIPRIQIQASLPNNSSQSTNKSPKIQRQKKQPTVAEIERAIGAGIFRDRDTPSVSEKSGTLFDAILSNSFGKTEGSVEKKLRETGEWIIDRTERKSRSYGKIILMGGMLGILPLWILSLLLAIGTIKLPFSTPFLDDLFL